MEGMVVTHFSHPLHSLVKAEAAGNFNCDGCKMEGYKQMFRCRDCDFKLHALCATCPMGLIFFMHPQHRLAMVSPPGTTHRCNVCTQTVLGISYRCAACEFNAHPVCALLPPTVKDGVHPDHTLTLIQSDPSPCTICRSECKGGRYRCSLCDADLHPECLQGTNASGSASGQVPRIRKRDQMGRGSFHGMMAFEPLASLDFSQVVEVCGDLVSLASAVLGV